MLEIATQLVSVENCKLRTWGYNRSTCVKPDQLNEAVMFTSWCL